MKTRLSRILSHAAFCLALFVTSSRAGEKKTPGDIPAGQVLVPYTSAAGSYSLKVPQGWTRSEKGSDVDFIDKFDGVAVIIVDAAVTPPRIQDLVARFGKAEKGFKVVSTKERRLPAGSALIVKYESKSETNPVTNKRVRLKDEAYAFYKYGKIAILILWAPVGTDNADQWKLISESFRW